MSRESRQRRRAKGARVKNGDKRLRWMILAAVLAGSFLATLSVATEPDARISQQLPPDTSNLLARVEQVYPGSVKRDAEGLVFRFSVPFNHVNDNSLSAIASLSSLKDLKLRFSTTDYTNLTAHGFEQLKQLSQLETLDIGCARVMSADRFAEICRLSSLKVLQASFCDPPRSSYALLTNLTKMEELLILGSKSFGDGELYELRSLPQLRRIILNQTSVSQDSLKFLPQFPSLTNAVIIQALPEGGTTNLIWPKP